MDIRAGVGSIVCAHISLACHPATPVPGLWRAICCSGPLYLQQLHSPEQAPPPSGLQQLM